MIKGEENQEKNVGIFWTLLYKQEFHIFYAWLSHLFPGLLLTAVMMLGSSHVADCTYHMHSVERMHVTPHRTPPARKYSKCLILFTDQS
jgi:hypothetical protein